jgi:hypothetical protein
MLGQLENTIPLMIRDTIHVVINLEHIDYLKISLFLNRI